MKTVRRRFRLITRKDLFELFVCIALASLFVLLSSGAAFGQGNVGINNPTPHAKSLLDLTSSDKGLLTPRMTAAQRTAMFPAPDATGKGMLVYQTDGTQGFYYYDGAAWQMLQAGGAGWGLLGNAGTNVATNFLGTTDNNSVAFRTNNLERMRVSYTGNVSIGAAIDPVNYRLYVEHNNASPVARIRNINATGFSGTHYTNDLLTAQAHFGMGNSASPVWQNMGYAGTTTAHPFVLTTTDLERMRIDAGGNVGIGTQSPYRLLEVSSANQGVQRITSNNAVNGSVLELNNTTAGNNGIGALNFLDNGTAVGQLMYHKTDGMTFRAANLERMRIDVNGNVGIGTIAPASKLHVSRGASGLAVHANASLALDASSSVYQHFLCPDAAESGLLFGSGSTAVDAGVLYHTGYVSHGLDFRTGGNATRMVLTSTGNVGIGTTAPNNRLHVVANAAGAMAMTVQNTNAGGWSGTNYTSNTGAGNATVGFDNATSNGFLGTTTNHAVTFISNWQERMRLTANGQLGVGTNAPAAKFDVVDAGSGIVARFNGTNPAGYSVAHWIRSDNIGGHVGFFNPGVGLPLAGNFVMGTFGSAPVSLTTNNIERVRIAVDGKVGIGTAAPTSEFEVNGYTKLGSDAPAIRMKKLTGTTPAAQGSNVSIAHGLTGSKILGVDILIESTPGNWVPVGSAFAGSATAFSVTATGISITTISGNSAGVLSKPVKILVTYEA